jgi:hypothetical protein
MTGTSSMLISKERSSNASAVETAVNYELGQVFGARLSALCISRYVDRAITDLTGSVCVDALAEMTSRLATHRILREHFASRRPAPLIRY